jgi:predicted helicase
MSIQFIQHFVGADASTQCLSLYRYIPGPDWFSPVPETGEASRVAETTSGQSTTGDMSGLQRVENITDWALGQFRKRYERAENREQSKKKGVLLSIHHSPLSKQDIFHYVYAVLHHLAYRAKYEINLKREFPRIPFYEDFWQWAEWGKRLIELHLGYEAVEPYPLERVETNIESQISNNGESDIRYSTPVTRLMARREKGEIEVDTVTTLRGVPAEAWDYRLGTYSALGWILERYEEKKPKDPTIAEKFNPYRFVDYKEGVIELLRRVCTVSVETMKIIREMP